MQLVLNSDTVVAATDSLRFEERGRSTLVVSPATGGWTILDDDPAGLALLKSLAGGRSVRVGDLEAENESSQPRAVLAQLLKRGLVALDGTALATSSARVGDVRTITPPSAHNQYPVLGVFHVHNWCNLACTYCYTIDEKMPRRGLSRELMIKAVDEMVHLPTPFSTFEFHGGEPTMAFADIEAVTLHAERVYAAAGKPVSFSVQTNAYNLKPAVCDFLAEHKFSVRVSLDGTSDTHNAFRIDHSGRGTYKGVVAGIKRLQERGIAVHALCVVHIGNVERICDMYDAMADQGVASIRFLPVFKTGRADESQWLDGDTYFEAYFGMLRHVVARSRSGKRTAPLPNLIAGELGSLRSFRREYMCMRTPCGAGVNMIAIDVNGELYPCEEMMGKPEFVFGNIEDIGIREAIDTSPVIAQLKGRHVEEIDECSSCTWKQMCHGGCVHKSYTHFKRLDQKSEHCSYYKRIYHDLIWMEADDPGSWAALSGAAG